MDAQGGAGRRATMAPMRPLIVMVLALALAACGDAAPAPPTPLPVPTLPAVGEIMAGATPGPVRVVGYLFVTPDGAAMVDGLRLVGPGAPASLDEGGIWLGATPPLPPEPVLTKAGGVSYVVAEAEGRLEGPGRYGPGGRYSYTLAEPVVRPRSARDLTIALLLANSGLYEGQPVRVSGQLLASAGSALLIERIGPGGVPDDQALQVKLARTPDKTTLAGLTQGGEGRVSYGPAQVIGIWRAGRLYPLAVIPG
jgi:hypothetical protein